MFHSRIAGTTGTQPEMAAFRPHCILLKIFYFLKKFNEMKLNKIFLVILLKII
jgi:hypothetical protein